MCGRYTLKDPEKIKDRFDAEGESKIQEPMFNVAPGMVLPVIVESEKREIRMMKWGLIPHWSKDPKIGYRMINARSESAAEKPSYAKPLRTQRCIVPATGFYEWESENGKQPWYFQPKDGVMWGLAGLYDVWKDAEGMEVKSYTILTKEANEMVAEVHNRMPVILKKEDEDEWLDSDIKDMRKIEPMLAGVEAETMERWEVSKRVNKANEDGESLIRKV